jgi:hypothetical protein
VSGGSKAHPAPSVGTALPFKAGLALILPGGLRAEVNFILQAIRSAGRLAAISQFLASRLRSSGTRPH